MNDATGVQGRECGEYLERDRHGLRHGHAALLQPLGERFAFEQFHGDEKLTAVFTDLVDLADVRVVDARRGARFAPEALARGLVVGDRRHRLQGHRTAEPFVAGGIHDAHRARSKLVGDCVVPDPFRCGSSGWCARNVRRRACR
jgi:hypothetical protein